MIVIVAICVLVLVVVAAFFAGGFGRTGTITDSEAMGRGCELWKTTKACATGTWDGIKIPNYRPAGEASDQSLKTACTRRGYTTETDCKVACGCP